MTATVCRRCGIPVWSAATKLCAKCWEKAHRDALAGKEAKR